MLFFRKNVFLMKKCIFVILAENTFLWIWRKISSCGFGGKSTFCGLGRKCVFDEKVRFEGLTGKVFFRDFGGKIHF